MSEPQNRTLNKIHDYLEGSLNEEQVDELWAELLSDDEAFDYMQTLAMLRKMERSEIRDPSSEPVPYELPRESRKPAVYFLRVAAAVAAVLLITVFTIYQSPDFGNGGVSAPLTSIDYGIERSGDIPNRVESVKSRVIELSVLDKTDEAILYIDQELGDGDLTEAETRELQILKGSIYYNNGRYRDAKLVFQKGLVEIDKQSDGLNYEKNLWYLANTLLQLKENEQALELVEEVVRLYGSYGRVAENLLKGYTE